jgi:hypothetical protein
MLDLCVSSNCAHGKPFQVLIEYASPFFAHTKAARCNLQALKMCINSSLLSNRKTPTIAKEFYKDLKLITIGILKHK